MELILEREIRSVKTTIGKLFVDGVFECFILEDVDRGLKCSMPLAEILERKIKAETCIPEGTYPVLITFSNRFKKDMPLVANVPGYEGIRIHPGNTEANTAGCLLPGQGRNVDNVIGSAMAFMKLYNKISGALADGQKVTITIKQ